MKIGIIGAMEVEVATLKSNMTVKNTVKKASMEFYEGTIGNTEVVVVRSGIGKVNAGICVQILIDLFGVTHVINTGIAGSLNADINIGDIVLSTDACYHDVDITVFGYKKGEIPQIGAAEFKADDELRAKAKASIKKAAPDIGVFEGRVCSGDQFISSAEVKDAIIKEHGGLCTEMEGAAIAQASYLNNTPFLIIRAISDKADGGAEVDYPTFEAKAAKDCAAIVMEIIAEL
ncbi:MAG: 5'-methylthioadenosine/adenosylhomocysteine nucleosidase [Butyrivibrio sp.]|uniref:adenosylhomocysteine nucleosidase n=1 Tax=Butyrivibrio hungatei TaxID=185008 RepID=A0A1G5FI64_9FIRM|nr:5'-methylthioadenosine/adenosylhomocysteine nucleosidase [Butyrivibrio hungatei]MBQ2610319.1 5'-methylthioadenosine/adenosylhomocysteine nucleosidase [Butyrivibrio sp.]MBQ4218594.1 5'-methylthioadenosine/adenosylhomocysteine nucleosidase [Butyrivibrio sp.]SCY38946.1 adenosylhomocysteine nucleosidase [Butyrivibrio hungatei]